MCYRNRAPDEGEDLRYPYPPTAMAKVLTTAFVLLAGYVAPTAALVSGDRAALLALNESTGGVLATDLGWGGATGTECNGSWEGVECGVVDGLERVTLLKLGFLQIETRLEGTLPAEIGNLTKLTQFELTDQHLGGNLPSQLSALTEMSYLSFRGNAFKGLLSTFLPMTRLRFLNLEGNAIGGPIPPAIGALTSLTNLELTGNRLTGTIPSSIGNLVLLQKLWLDANSLEGTIPAEIGELVKLTELRLGGNDLVGSIPGTIGALTSLTLLQIGLCQLSGPLPSELGELSSLEELSLGTNRLSGGLEVVDWSKLGALRSLFLDNNALEGAIPAELLALPNLAQLQLAANKLSGEVPDVILGASLGAALNLGWNALSAAPEVAARLDALSAGSFSATQTLAPMNPRAEGTSASSIRLYWDAARLTSVTGGYRIAFEETGTGSSSQDVIEVDGKGVTTAEVVGLQPNREYMFRVESFSEPHAANANLVYSTDATPVSTSPSTVGLRGRIAFVTSDSSTAEGRVHVVQAARLGGLAGPMHADLTLQSGPDTEATPGDDLELITLTLDWADQEGGSKPIEIAIAADGVVEDTENARLELLVEDPATVGSPASMAIEILDRTVAADASAPVIALAADGLELSVWAIVQAGRKDHDLSGRFTAGRTTGTPAEDFVIFNSQDDEFPPVVLPLADTFVVGCIETSGDLKRRIRFCEIDRENGGCKQAKTLVNSSSVSELSASIAQDGFWLTWRTDKGIRLAKFATDLSRVGDSVRVASDPTARSPQVTSLPDGGALVVWIAAAQGDGGAAETRPSLRGRAFDPASGLGPVSFDLAEAESVEIRAPKLAARANGAIILSWIGVHLADTAAGPIREGPQLHIRKLEPSGAPKGGTALGCPTCGELVESYSLVSHRRKDRCLVTWVARPNGGNAPPILYQAKLRACATPTTEQRLTLAGEEFSPHQPLVATFGGRLLVFGQRESRATLDLRKYQCAGGSLCQD